MGTESPKLSTGSRLVLLGEAGDPLRSAIVVRVSDGLIWISGIEEPGAPGEMVKMVHVVPGDAQYVAPARVELVPPETLVLRRVGSWRRSQRRSHVRLTTYDVALEVERHGRRDQPPEREKLQMVDVSAGGAAGRERSELAPGEIVTCGFHLQGEGSFELQARVVRVDARGASRIVGFEFVGADLEEQAALRRWIYREEARRHRDAKRRNAEGGR